MMVVQIDGIVYGPFEEEEECYDFAAKVSQEPNDWTPLVVFKPEHHPLLMERV